MDTRTVHAPRDTQRLASLLDSPEICNLIARLDDTRWTGRPGYPIRSMVGMCLVKALLSSTGPCRVGEFTLMQAASDQRREDVG